MTKSETNGLEGVQSHQNKQTWCREALWGETSVQGSARAAHVALSVTPTPGREHLPLGGFQASLVERTTWVAPSAARAVSLHASVQEPFLHPLC